MIRRLRRFPRIRDYRAHLFRVAMLCAVAVSPFLAIGVIHVSAQELGFSDVYSDFGYSDVFSTDFGYSDAYAPAYGYSDVYPRDYGYSDVYPTDYGYSLVYTTGLGYSGVYASDIAMHAQPLWYDEYYYEEYFDEEPYYETFEYYDVFPTYTYSRAAPIASPAVSNANVNTNINNVNNAVSNSFNTVMSNNVTAPMYVARAPTMPVTVVRQVPVVETVVTPVPVAQPVPVATTPPPYVSLSQIPYTGFDWGPVGNALFLFGLIAFSAAGAYLLFYDTPAFSGYRNVRNSPLESVFARAREKRGPLMRTVRWLLFADTRVEEEGRKTFTQPKPPSAAQTTATPQQGGSERERREEGIARPVLPKTKDTMVVIEGRDDEMPRIVINRE